MLTGASTILGRQEVELTHPATGRARLSKQNSSSAGEIIPDSEEERKLVAPTEVIEISSDEDTEDDHFSHIPGAWTANNPTKNRSKLSIPTISRKVKTRGTPRARRIIESSGSEESDAEPHPHVSQEIIELSDSSPERPAIIRLTTKPSMSTKSRLVPPTVQEISDSDTFDMEGAILTMDEPRSARKPIRIPNVNECLTELPLGIPGKRLRDLFVGFDRDVTLNAHPSPAGTPTRKHPASVAATPYSTRRSSSKTSTTSHTGKKAQAAAEHARRVLYAQELFKELNHDVFNDGLPSDTKLNWNKRLLTTAGRAKWHRSKEGIQTTEIELAQKILDCDERIRNTLSHEMCHLASWIIDGRPSEVHGIIFKTWASKVMRKRPEIEISTRHDYEISYPFNWKCLKCSKTYGRHSKSIDVDKCLCGACREGKLMPLFSTRAPKTTLTPKTSRLASTRPQDSPKSVQPVASINTESSSDISTHPIYSIRDSNSDSEFDITSLTEAIASINLPRS